MRSIKLSLTEDLKMLRETLCVAQTAIGQVGSDGRTEEHIERLQKLIDECDRMRPIGPDGTHGNLHTTTCGCEDVCRAVVRPVVRPDLYTYGPPADTGVSRWDICVRPSGHNGPCIDAFGLVDVIPKR